jgi:hypothetical protein
MVRVAKFFSYLVFFLLALMYFMPKTSIYYFAEKELQKQGVVIAHEEVLEHGLSLELKHLDLYVESIESAKIAVVNISLFGLYNEIDAKNIALSDALSSMLPLHIEKASVNYSVLHPKYIVLNAVGAFGTLQARADILKRELRAVLKPSKLMRRQYSATLHNFKKQANGEYEYVQSF